MNQQITLDRLKELKLEGMVKSYEAILSTPVQQQPNYQIIVNRLIEAEQQYRKQKRTNMYLKLSKLRYNAVLEQVECSTSRNLTTDQLSLVSDCSFIERAENILITGATGCGKSYLACALGRQACSLGYKVIYFGMNRFIEKIALSKIDGTYLKLINYLAKCDLVILDDFGLHSLDTITRLALLQILEDRCELKSTMIVSQLPTQNWYEYLDEPTLADAIVDRLFSNAHRFDLKGESLRKKLIKN
ncbi:MAG: IS21-like element helper ATPase IstB [Paludibacter sp.]|nr:IS21-like element helper ATPase IstB [Paludibacter sp.]